LREVLTVVDELDRDHFCCPDERTAGCFFGHYFDPVAQCRGAYGPESPHKSRRASQRASEEEGRVGPLQHHPAGGSVVGGVPDDPSAPLNLYETYMTLPERLPAAVLGNKKPPISGGFLEADEGTRTLDLLHGKQTL
jgi:hypothetical protein